MYWVDAQTGEIANRRFRRDERIAFLAQRPAGLVALEACGSAHWWARKIRALGVKRSNVGTNLLLKLRLSAFRGRASRPCSRYFSLTCMRSAKREHAEAGISKSSDSQKISAVTRLKSRQPNMFGLRIRRSDSPHSMRTWAVGSISPKSLRPMRPINCSVSKPLLPKSGHSDWAYSGPQGADHRVAIMQRLLGKTLNWSANRLCDDKESGHRQCPDFSSISQEVASLSQSELA